jgi:hypothetical protein
LYHILIGQDVILATPLRLVFRATTPYPGVGKFRQNGFVQPVAKFFNRRTFRVQYHRLFVIGHLSLGLSQKNDNGNGGWDGWVVRVISHEIIVLSKMHLTLV